MNNQEHLPDVNGDNHEEDPSSGWVDYLDQPASTTSSSDDIEAGRRPEEQSLKSPLLPGSRHANPSDISHVPSDNQVAISTYERVLKAAQSVSCESMAVVLVSCVASFLQSTFVSSAEEDLNPKHQYEFLVWIGLGIVFIGYGIVNIGFSENLVRRLKCESKKIELNNGDHMSLAVMHEKLKALLPDTKGFTRKYPLSYPLRGIFIAIEFILATFAVILNVASFYIFLARKNMSAIEKNLLVAAGIFVSLPYVGLNLIPTEKVSTFLMSLISRKEDLRGDDRQNVSSCYRWLYSQIPGCKEAGMLFLVSIIDALHAVQALGYEKIFLEGEYPIWFGELMEQELAIALVNFLFLYATKFEKTKNLLYGFFNFQQPHSQGENALRQEWKPLHLLSVFFGLCMSAKAFVPSYSTFNDFIVSEHSSSSVAVKGLQLTAVCALTVGSATAPLAFYSMNFYDAINKRFSSSVSLSSRTEQRALEYDQVHLLLGQLYDFVMMKGDLSRHVVPKLKHFLQRQEWNARKDESLVLHLVFYLYHVMQLKGASTIPEMNQTMREKLTAINDAVGGNTLLMEFESLVEELSKKEHYDNSWLCFMAAMFCGVYSVVSSYSYSALLINAIPGHSSLKNALVIFLSFSLYVLSHERIAFRLDELGRYLCHDTKKSDQPGALFFYASLDPEFVHGVSAITTLVVVIDMLAGLMAFIATSSWCEEKAVRELALIMGSILSVLATPYLCLHMDLYLTNGPTKHARDKLMCILSRQRIASMLCGSSTQNGVPHNFSGLSLVSFGIDWLATVCLAWSVLEGSKNKVLITCLFVPYVFLFFNSLLGRVLDSGEMFRAFFSSGNRSPTAADDVFQRQRSSTWTVNELSSPLFGSSGIGGSHNWEGLPVQATTLRDEAGDAPGIAYTRVLSDLLSAWFKSLFFVRYFNSQAALSSPDIMVPSVILAFMMVVGLSVMPSKGPVFRNKRSLLDLHGSPRQRKLSSPVNFLCQARAGTTDSLTLVAQPSHRDSESPVCSEFDTHSECPEVLMMDDERQDNGTADNSLGAG